MKKSVKALGITAALAVMIPYSAYAATTDEATGKSDAKTEAADLFKVGGRGGIGSGIGGSFVGEEILSLLNLDKDSYLDKVKAGATLAEIAEEQGVSRESLKTALTEAHDQRLEERKKTFAENLDGLIDSELQAGKQGGKGGPAIGAAKDLTAAAATLGLTEEELREQLKGGKSLGDLAEEKGVDVQKLIDAQKAAIEAGINERLAEGKLTQEQADERLAKAAETAEKIVNGQIFGGGRHHGEWKGPNAGGEKAGTDAAGEAEAAE